jgi:threonine/homoserine/homoserine lactone efflux protein
MQFLLNLPSFVFAVFLLALVPGQTVAMVLRQAIVGGSKVAFWSIFGSSSALVIWGLLSGLGLSIVFQQNAVAYAILKWTGVAYLVLLSVQTILQSRKASGKFDFDDNSAIQGGFSAYRTGFLTNMTNAKAAVFAVAFLPLYVPTDFPMGVGVFTLGCVWALVSISWYSVLILGVDKASVWLAKPKARRGLTLASGLGIALLALGLVLS